MTKQEYLSSLEEKLAIFNTSLAKEILDDYKSHFDIALEKGKTEEEVAADLGEIDEIIAEINQLYESYPKTLQQDTIHKQPAPAEDHLTLVKPDIEPDTEPKIRTEDKPQESITLKLPPDQQETENSQNPYKDLKPELRLDAGWPVRTEAEQTEEPEKPLYTEERNQKTDKEDFVFHKPNTSTSPSFSKKIPISKLVLESDCADVNVKQSKNDAFGINYRNEGTEKQKIMFRFFGEQKGDTFYGRVFRENTAGRFFHFKSDPCIIIDVFLPPSMQSASIHGTSGDIRMEAFQAEELNIKSASGTINLNQIKCPNSELETTSGSIHVSYLHGSYAALHSKSGSFHVKNSLINKMAVKTLSGSIEIVEAKSLHIDADTASGDVKAESTTAENIKLTSKSGDILLKTGTASTINLNSISGDVAAYGVTAENMNAGTVSGDVNLHTNANYISSKSISGDVNIKNESILSGEFHSTSGSIHIDLIRSKGFEARTDTLSGEINLHLRCENLHITPKKGIHNLGNGESKLKVKTMSGDIVIKGS